MKIKFPKYERSFWIGVFSIIFISAVLFVLNNFSSLASKQVYENTAIQSQRVSKDLYKIQNDLDTFVNILNGFIYDSDVLNDKTGLQVLQNEITAVLSIFLEGENSANGYFYQINTQMPDAEYEVWFDKKKGKASHISTLLEHSFMIDLNQSFHQRRETKWITVYNAFSNSKFLTCITPMYKGEIYLGFVGITIDMQYLNDIVLKMNSEKEKYKKTFLFTEDKEILVHSEDETRESMTRFNEPQYMQLFRNVDKNGYVNVKIQNKNWVCAYCVLPSGQIFISEQYRLGDLKSLNWFILLITFFSVLSMWIVQKNRITGLSSFDKIASILMAREKETLFAMDMNRKKAVLALGVGASGVFLSYSVYFFILGKSRYDIIAYFITGIMILLFARIRISLFDLKVSSYVVVYGLGLFPIFLHVSRGGFGEGNTGITISWILIIMLLSQFLLKDRRSDIATNLLFVILFFDLFLEIYLLHNFDSERLIVFVTSLLFMSFSIIIAIRIYINSAIKDFNTINELSNEIKESQIQLVQKEKMVALGQLIAGVAHEINTPIGAIKASAQTMESTFITVSKLMYRCAQEFDDVDYDCFFCILHMSKEGVKEMKTTFEIRKQKEKIKQYFEEIDLPHRDEILEKLIRFEITDIGMLKENLSFFKNQDICEIMDIVAVMSSFTVGIQTILFAIARVSKIIFALKSYAYIGTEDKKVPFDIVKNIEEVLVLYHNQIKQSIEVIKDYDKDLPNVLGKQDEMYQVWTNLIQNAIYAMNGGGTLTISIKSTSEDWVKVKIKDTGTGIPEGVMKRIFEPFYTTKPLGEGSGMGLDISRKVIINHNGTIEVKSEKGKGTMFTIKLPALIPHQYNDILEDEMK